MNVRPSSTIYVGNIQSIDDETLREYFQRFGQIEEFFHNCSRSNDQWLIDYRFIRFSAETDLNVFLTNKIDHTICRIHLDIHSYDAAFHDDTRLTSDRKICIAHTNSKLDRNIIKKAFTKYGRILNCTCVSSGNGLEYVYIEFESINSVRSIFASKQNHFAGRTALAVKQSLRPAQVGIKIETTTNDCQSKDPLKLLLMIRPVVECNPLATQDLKDLEREYDLIIRKDFDEITYQIEKYLHTQQKTYTKLNELLLRS